MRTSKTFRWRSPSNIALIKYWGKEAGQRPKNPSLSLTLQKSFTEMELSFLPGPGTGLDFQFEGKENGPFQAKVQNFLNSLHREFPFLQQGELRISSRNSFPHSAGIASSASSMSALALCLCSLENDLTGNLKNPEDFWRKASHVARLGSGSASRSVYGGFVLWGEHENFPGSSQEVAIPLMGAFHKNFQRLQNAILIVSSGEKEVSSRLGHQLMENNPFAPTRYREAHRQLSLLVWALEKGDWAAFARVVEEEAMMLHGLMMTSRPYIILLKPGSLVLMEKIRRFRQMTGVPVTFTLDAGPNIHLLYPYSHREVVGKFIKDELSPLCEGGLWIADEMGAGPSSY